jgi:hypothetical protein
MDDLVEKAAQLFGYRSYEDACSVAHSSEVKLINRHAEALAEIRRLRAQVARYEAYLYATAFGSNEHQIVIAALETDNG